MNMIRTETLNSLVARRSIRRYLPQQITEDELNAVLRAGIYAPTGMGAQSPVIVAVQDKTARDALSEMNAAVMGSKSDPFYGAPTVLCVLADSTRGTYREDGALVIGNMLLAAYAVGLGSCWIHRAKEMFESDSGKMLLRTWGLDERYVGVGNCILGYPADPAPAPKPRKDDYIIRV